MHNTLSNICCVGGLPYTTHFQIYNLCFVGSSRCVRGFTIRNTLSNICCVGGRTCCVGGLPYTTHFQNMFCVNHFLQS